MPKLNGNIPTKQASFSLRWPGHINYEGMCMPQGCEGMSHNCCILGVNVGVLSIELQVG